MLFKKLPAIVLKSNRLTGVITENLSFEKTVFECAAKKPISFLIPIGI